MNLRDLLLSWLVQWPKGRERAHKDAAIVALLIEKKYPELRQYKHVLRDFCRDAESCNRYWRYWMDERPDLRGTDWEDGKALQESKRQEFAL